MITKCTLVLEYNYGKPGETLGSVWVFNGDGSKSREEAEPFASLPGWSRIAGPLDYEEANRIHVAVSKFLREAGVEVISMAAAD